MKAEKMVFELLRGATDSALTNGSELAEMPTDLVVDCFKIMATRIKRADLVHSEKAAKLKGEIENLRRQMTDLTSELFVFKNAAELKGVLLSTCETSVAELKEELEEKNREIKYLKASFKDLKKVSVLTEESLCNFLKARLNDRDENLKKVVRSGHDFGLSLPEGFVKGYEKALKHFKEIIDDLNSQDLAV